MFVKYHFIKRFMLLSFVPFATAPRRKPLFWSRVFVPKEKQKMLEKTRVVHHGAGERIFHIFDQVLTSLRWPSSATAAHFKTNTTLNKNLPPL